MALIVAPVLGLAMLGGPSQKKRKTQDRVRGLKVACMQAVRAKLQTPIEPQSLTSFNYGALKDR